MDYGWNGLNYFNINGTAGTAVKANNTPTTAWWHILRFNHANSSGYYTDLAVPFDANSLYYKRVAAGVLMNGKWVRILDELNYTSYVNPANFAKGNAGSATIGVYVTRGTVRAMTYSLNANLNSGTARKLAYYRFATTVASYVSTVGASNRGIYLNEGTPTAMTYYLDAAVNAGKSSKLAYYSSANSIDDYTGTVGSSTTPMYLFGGIPTVCGGVVIKYWAIYTINSINSTVTFTRDAGNCFFLISITRIKDNGKGAYCVYCSYPSGYSWSNTIIWGSGSHASEKASHPEIKGSLYVSTSPGGSNYFYVRTSDDASTNNGKFRLFMIWF